jgi:hypothetical protein
VEALVGLLSSSSQDGALVAAAEALATICLSMPDIQKRAAAAGVVD